MGIAGEDFALTNLATNKNIVEDPAAIDKGSAIACLSDPATCSGAMTRTVTQTWVADPNHPELDGQFAMGTTRVILQTMTTEFIPLEGKEETYLSPAVPYDENGETYDYVPGQVVLPPPVTVNTTGGNGIDATATVTTTKGQ